MKFKKNSTLFDHLLSIKARWRSKIRIFASWLMGSSQRGLDSKHFSTLHQTSSHVCYLYEIWSYKSVTCASGLEAETLRLAPAETILRVHLRFVLGGRLQILNDVRLGVIVTVRRQCGQRNVLPALRISDLVFGRVHHLVILQPSKWNEWTFKLMITVSVRKFINFPGYFLSNYLDSMIPRLLMYRLSKIRPRNCHWRSQRQFIKQHDHAQGPRGRA